MRFHSIPQKRDVFCIFITKTSLFPFGFKNDFYVICALTAVLVEYVCLDDIARRLWGKEKKENPKSEQQRMDDSMADYIRWATPKNEPDKVSGTSLG